MRKIERRKKQNIQEIIAEIIEHIKKKTKRVKLKLFYCKQNEEDTIKENLKEKKNERTRKANKKRNSVKME